METTVDDRVQVTRFDRPEARNAMTPAAARDLRDAIGDFAYADATARFGEAFVNVGLVPDTGGTVLLPWLVGLRRAKELTMTGRLFDADEAATMGLINEAVPTDTLDDRVDELLETLGRKPTTTLGLIKEGIHGNLGRPVDDALDRERALQVRAYGTDAHEEGVAAFLDDRTTDFD